MVKAYLFRQKSAIAEKMNKYKTPTLIDDDTSDKENAPNSANSPAPKRKFQSMDVDYDMSVAPLDRKARCERSEPWPRRALMFKTWSDDSAFDIVLEELQKRGWNYLGEPCDSEYMKEHLPLAAKGLEGYTLPRRCLFFVDEHDAAGLKGIEYLHKDQYKISAYPGTEPATYKTTWTKAINHCDFYPTSYNLPLERDAIEPILKSDKETFWICKPRNDYGGEGIVVYSSKHAEFLKQVDDSIINRRQFIVQKYIGNPHLVGGYKYHLRVYLLATSLNPVRAYVWNGGHVLFATKPFTNDERTMGKNFDEFAHLTNLHINCVDKNLENVVKDKPVIGSGCVWSSQMLFDHLRQTRPNEFDEDAMWTEILKISEVVVKHIATYPTVKKHKIMQNQHFQFFGLDILLDDNLKVWLLEGNTSPGLCYSQELLGKEKIRFPSFDLDASITKDMFNDSMNLMGLDYDKSGDCSNFWEIC